MRCVGLALLFLTACAHALPSPAPAPPSASGVPILRRRLTTDPWVQEIRPLHRTLSFAWPVVASAVNSDFGSRQDPLRHQMQFHYGVDLQANYGAVIRAAAPGRVRRAGWNAGHGRTVCLEHQGGFATCYAHLSQVMVLPNTYVRSGAPLGLVGNSGRSTGPHLHFEILKDGTFIDPLAYLGQTISLE